MAVEIDRVWMRVGYAARGRLKGRPMGWVAVSESIPLDVAVLSEDEAPAAVAFARDAPYPDMTDRYGWNAAHGAGGFSSFRQEFTLRQGPAGLLAPVLGPDGVTPLSPEGLTAMAATVGEIHAKGRIRGVQPPVWSTYPGSTGSSVEQIERSERWPVATQGSPNRPVWACPELASLSFVEFDDAERGTQLAAVRRRIGDMALVGGVLHRSCGAPVVALATGKGEAPAILLPGRDRMPWHPDGAGTLACVDFRTAMPEYDALRPALRPVVREMVDLPHGDFVEENLRLLPHLVDWRIKNVVWHDIRKPALPFLAWLADLPDRIARASEAGTLADLEAEACDAVIDVTARLAGDLGDDPRFKAAFVRLPDWVDAVRLQRLGVERAHDLDDAEVTAFTP